VSANAQPRLWSAILHPCGPRYETWKKVFGSDQVLLQSARTVKAELGDEKDVEVYMLNLAAMTLQQRARLLGLIARNFGVPIYEVERQIAEKGFPIRAEDVIVSFSMRAFI